MKEVDAGARIHNYRWNKDLLVEYVNLFPSVSRCLNKHIESHLILRAPFRGWEFGEVWNLYSDENPSIAAKAVTFVKLCNKEQQKPLYMKKFCEFIKSQEAKTRQDSPSTEEIGKQTDFNLLM